MGDRIQLAEDDIVSEPEYWQKHSQIGQPLKRRRKCCKQCPANDMYLPYVIGLERQPNGVRVQASERWPCHVTPTHSCKGNFDINGEPE